MHPLKKSMDLYRGVEQLVARQAHNLEVACSSLASATTKNALSVLFLFLTGFVFSDFFSKNCWLYQDIAITLHLQNYYNHIINN